MTSIRWTTEVAASSNLFGVRGADGRTRSRRRTSSAADGTSLGAAEARRSCAVRFHADGIRRRDRRRLIRVRSRDGVDGVADPLLRRRSNRAGSNRFERAFRLRSRVDTRSDPQSRVAEFYRRWSDVVGLPRDLHRRAGTTRTKARVGKGAVRLRRDRSCGTSDRGLTRSSSRRVWPDRYR